MPIRRVMRDLRPQVHANRGAPSDRVVNVSVLPDRSTTEERRREMVFVQFHHDEYVHATSADFARALRLAVSLSVVAWALIVIAAIAFLRLVV